MRALISRNQLDLSKRNQLIKSKFLGNVIFSFCYIIKEMFYSSLQTNIKKILILCNISIWILILSTPVGHEINLLMRDRPIKPSF